MVSCLRRNLWIGFLAGALLHGALAPAAADWVYFRLKSPTGQVTDTNPPPTQNQISYFVLGPQSGTVDQSYAATSQVAGATADVTFSIFSGSLPPGVTLNAMTGSVSGVPTQPGSFSAILRAYDAGSATAALAQLTVTVSPVFSVVGIPSGAGTVGSPYSAQFSGSGGSTPYSFSTASVLPPGLSLDVASGVLTGVPTQAGAYPNVSITGQDAAGRTASSVPFMMTISDPLSIAWTVSAGRQGDTYSSAPSASGGHAPLFYVLNGALPSGLNFSGSTGAITGTPMVSGDFSVQIAVGDQDGRSASTGYKTISIAPAHVEAPLAIAGTPATSGQVDVDYSASFSASGGSGAGHVFDLAGNALPDGLTLNADGTITGAPTNAGTYPGIQVRVTDSEAHTALSNTFSIIVAPAPTLMISGNPSSTAKVGVVYSANFTAFEGSGAGYSFSSVGDPLPPGLTLSQVTQAQVDLSGTPSYVGTYSGLQIRVTDSKGHIADSSPFSITVAAPAGAPIAISGTPQAWADLGVAYSAKLHASGGTGQGYGFSLVGGALPAGLQLLADGTIAGTPNAAGSSSFQLQLTDSAGDVASNSYTIAVASQLTVVGSPTASVYAGSPYSAQFSTSGGTAPYSYALASGVLPTWLTLDASSGLLSGTPSAADVGMVGGLVIQATTRAGEAAVSPAFSVQVLAATAVDALAGGKATFRSGSGDLIAVELDTSLPSANWTLSVTPSDPGFTAAEPTTGYSTAFAAAIPSVSAETAYSVRPTASNAYAAATAPVLNFTVAPKLSVSGGPASGIDGEVGLAVSTPAASTGTTNVGVVTYALTQNGTPQALSTLCPGLSFSTSNGTITGSPTAACNVGNLKIAATDDFDGAIASTQTAFAISIAGAQTAPTGTLMSSGVAGVTYSSGPLTTQGGAFPYTWVLASGALPAGLSLNTSTGVVSGTPVAQGAYTFTLKVTDALGVASPASSSQTVAITQTPSNNGTYTTSAKVGTAYSSAHPATAGGPGTAPYAYHLSSGSIPPGLTLNSDGSLTGTPSTAGTYTFSVYLTDANGVSSASVGPSTTITVASNVTPGSTSYGAGTFSVTIPTYNTITVEIWGAGGGGGGNSGYNYQPQDHYFGGTGGVSYFVAPSGAIYAYGGTGGGNCNPTYSGTPGSPGGATGGDVNTVGGGNAGSLGNTWNAPRGGLGGSGGYVKKTWTLGAPGAPVPGSAYTLLTGVGGAPGYGDWATGIYGPGASATARVTWN